MCTKMNKPIATYAKMRHLVTEIEVNKLLGFALVVVHVKWLIWYVYVIFYELISTPFI